MASLLTNFIYCLLDVANYTRINSKLDASLNETQRILRETSMESIPFATKQWLAMTTNLKEKNNI